MKLSHNKIDKPKVLTPFVKNRENLLKIKRYKKRDIIEYKNNRYFICSYYDLKEKWIFYELLLMSNISYLKHTDLKKYLYSINQVSLIESELQKKLWKKVEVNEWKGNSFKIHTELFKNKKIDKKIESYKINKKDYHIWFNCKKDKIKPWWNNDNEIKIILEIDNYQYNISELITDLKITINKIKNLF